MSGMGRLHDTSDEQLPEEVGEVIADLEGGEDAGSGNSGIRRPVIDGRVVKGMRKSWQKKGSRKGTTPIIASWDTTNLSFQLLGIQSTDSASHLEAKMKSDSYGGYGTFSE